MASSKQKELRKKHLEEKKRESMAAQENGRTTSIFRCGKCKSRNCTYTQLQTRSADEPMTTFVNCVDCGNRWRC